MISWFQPLFPQLNLTLDISLYLLTLCCGRKTCNCVMYMDITLKLLSVSNF